MEADYKIALAESLGVEPTQTVLQAVAPYIYGMLVGAFAMLIVKSGSSIAFAFVAENLTMGVRTDLYITILTKHMGWHDDPKNASGIMCSTLSSETQKLNGVSSEGTAVIIEGLAALIFGVAAAFFFSWPIAVCGAAICPFLVVASAISQKHDNAQFFNMDEENVKEKERDELIVGDSVQNYKTVASFGNDQIILDEY
jgi:ATP-binding cassette subfamily B (MDR/TAP) protein 1